MKKSYDITTNSAIFKRIATAELPPERTTYEGYRFSDCSFGNANLSGLNFMNCVFENCDLSLASLRQTSLKEVRFLRCKLLGIQFGECNKFLLQLGFEQCMIRLSTFCGLNLRNTVFEGCDLQEADFSEADLSGAVFGHCDLHRATFFRSNLEKADFRSAYGYSIPPESNRLKKARFSMPDVLGLLDGYGIEIE